jgi:hypothetical protein
MPNSSGSESAVVAPDTGQESGAEGVDWEEMAMTKVYVLLAVGVLALGATAGRADDDAAAAPQPADAAVAPVPLPPPGRACCFTGCAPRSHGCQHVWEWLTYCPSHSPCCCHHGCHGCSSCGGGDGTCCCSCTPCCTPLYMYFLDRCQPNFGYKLPIPTVVGPIPARTPVEGPPGESLDPCDGQGQACHNGHP